MPVEATQRCFLFIVFVTYVTISCVGITIKAWRGFLIEFIREFLEHEKKAEDTKQNNNVLIKFVKGGPSVESPGELRTYPEERHRDQQQVDGLIWMSLILQRLVTARATLSSIFFSPFFLCVCLLPIRLINIPTRLSINREAQCLVHFTFTLIEDFNQMSEQDFK